MATQEASIIAQTPTEELASYVGKPSIDHLEKQ
jgi:hypothetical protein